MALHVKHQFTSSKWQRLMAAAFRAYSRAKKDQPVKKRSWMDYVGSAFTVQGITLVMYCLWPIHNPLAVGFTLIGSGFTMFGISQIKRKMT